ncbi:MAG: hypothetical protein R3Y29_06920 [bacterium]
MNISGNSFAMTSINSLYSSQNSISSSSSASTDESTSVSYSSGDAYSLELSKEGMEKAQGMKGKDGPPPPPPGGGKGDMTTEDTSSTEETSELNLLDQVLLEAEEAEESSLVNADAFSAMASTLE